MRAEEIKSILVKLSAGWEDPCRAAYDRLREHAALLKGMNGPWTGSGLKGLMLKAFNRFNRTQYAMNTLVRESVGLLSDALLADPDGPVAPHSAGTPAVSVFVPFDFTPANFGGGTRVYHLYRALSRRFVVNAVGVADRGARRRTIAITPNFTVHVVPHSQEYSALKSAGEAATGGRLHDLLLLDRYRLIPELTELCESLSCASDVMIASHPYAFPMLKELHGRARLVYESHNIEYVLKKTYFPRDDAASRAWIDTVRLAEEAACRGSDLVTAVCGEDADALSAEFGVGRGRIVIVPNGVDTRRALFTDPSARAALKARLGIRAPLVVFVGSDHGPNVEAVEFIAGELAPRNERIVHLVAGSVGGRFAKRLLPPNVLLLGVLPDGELRALYRVADAAANPVFSGSGTNLKLFDYAAHGVPVVSTPFGMRGAAPLAEQVAVAGRGEFFEALRGRLAESGSPPELERVRTCRRIVEEQYDWEVVARAMGDAVDGLLK